ncbi:MAG: EAL domain-containing protein [Devosia nanyangense]|uniref:EAL domain-containing protein n=1 Tax=Devosia nanyangense TaxID=1228055 RepID=A0A933L465_9HYPH|nr:EAL domain-containing protein [Devosia nanyangense]
MTLGFILWSAQGVDERSLEHEINLARHVISAQLDRIPHDQESVTIWDDSINHLKPALDTHWVDVNLGVWMSDFFGHDEVIVLDASNRPIYAMAEGEMTGLEAARDALPTLNPLISELRRKISGGGLDAYEAGTAPNPPRASDLVVVHGVLSLVSMTPIISDSGDIVQARGTEYIHVSMVHLAAAYAGRLGEEYLIPDASFTEAASGVPDRAMLPLSNRAGRFITFLEWTRTSPGQAMLNQTIPAIAGAFLIAGIIAFLLVDQLWRKSRALEAGRADAEHQARHDRLTGLPNRANFEAELAHVLAERPTRERRISLLMLDLDRFKAVNDTLGHRAGDDLIRAVSQRLRQLVAPGDHLARLGGDEFALIHFHAPGPDDPLALSKRIIEALGKPFDVHGSEAFVGASIGIATAEGGEADSREVARKADIALYEAKATGRNRAVFFEESMSELLQNRHMIEGELREALRRDDQLSVAFQPLYGADHTSMIGAEALARWHNPRLGQVSPAHFISIAESSGLIERLGQFVLRQACELGAKWPGRTIAVNMSPVQLRNPRFPQEVFAVLRETGMRPGDLELEITEGILLEDASIASEALHIFRSSGIRIALDDFGTGYSSLNYLKRYPVDRIKIDRSFVSQLAPGHVSVAIVEAMVRLAHALKIEVTAEGVETEEQVKVLTDLGCNIFQGFLLSPPITAAALEAMLGHPVRHVDDAKVA